MGHMSNATRGTERRNDYAVNANLFADLLSFLSVSGGGVGGQVLIRANAS